MSIAGSLGIPGSPASNQALKRKLIGGRSFKALRIHQHCCGCDLAVAIAQEARAPPILKIMRDFIVGFEDLAEGLFWYFWDVFEFAADEFLLFCLVFASLAEEFFARLLSQILIA
nr:phytolongin Phyl1.1 isoform X1 [Ipomoea trifida]GMD68787.1 phytolongin Phyl1.1 isoform X1 [Ipomoea batatas]GMD70845.1 phytolongin Phyl1.1 isoform X1 [Ipomoea batatas]